MWTKSRLRFITENAGEIKSQQWNHQIHFYPLRNKNENKIFISIPYSDRTKHLLNGI